MTHPLKAIQQRIDNGTAPSSIEVGVDDEMNPVLRVGFGHRTFTVDMTEAEEVTGEPDALVGSTPCVLVETYVPRSGVLSDPRLLFVAEVDRDCDESAEYSAVSEGYVNETFHPDQHLTHPHGGENKYFLFER